MSATIEPVEFLVKRSGEQKVVVKVSVVIPCLNESKTIENVVKRATVALKQYGYEGEIVVSDNGSTDDSAAIAKSCGARVIPAPVRGYGSALLCGIQASEGPLVIMGDADDTYDFMEMNRLIEPLLNGYDFVIGTRLKGEIEKGAMPVLHRYLGTPVLTYLINVFFQTKISDCNCGIRAFTKDAFESMEPYATGMEFASEMIIKAGLMKLRIAEVPVTLRVDYRDRPPHLRTWQDGWRHLRFILAYAADKILLIPGVICILIGLTGFFSLAQRPIWINNFSMDYHFLFPSAILIILGTQLILSTMLVKTYTGLSEYDKAFQRRGRLLTVEHFMILGLLVLSVGLATNIGIMVYWLRHYGRELFAVRPAIIALTLMAVGGQIFFNAFVIGVLRIPHRQRGQQ